VKLFGLKAVLITYLGVIPKMVLGIGWLPILLAFFILIFTANVFGLIVLVTPHAIPDSEFPVTDIQRKLPTTWLAHQLRTTNDVEANNWFTRFFMGLFNYPIALHLFPSIHHAYYPEISSIIKKFGETLHLPYRRFPLLVFRKKHYQLLKNNTLYESLFEEVM